MPFRQAATEAVILLKPLPRAGWVKLARSFPMIYYHGTSTEADISYKLLPPSVTGVIQEAGRKKNLDAVFFTTDYGSAGIYAGRAVNRLGGSRLSIV